MSDIRFNNWKHQSGTGGVTQNAAGNVGIGSTLPASALDIGGDTHITGVTTASNFKTGSSNLHSAGVEVAGVNVLGADTPIGTGSTIYDDGGARFSGIVTATTFVGALTGTASGNATISSNADNRIITGGSGNALTGESTLTYSGDTLLSTNSNFVIKSIDTNASNSENYIQFNAGYITYDSDASNSTGYSGHYFQADGAEKLRINGSGQLIFDADTNTYIARPAADTFAFTTGGAERIRINSQGKVLVNTTTASSAGNSQYSRLEVSGNSSSSTGPGHLSVKRGTASASLSNGDTLSRLIFSSLDGGDFAYIQTSVDGSPSGSDFPGRMMFYTCADGASSATERLRIASDGAVTIDSSSNTMHPGAALNVISDKNVETGLDDMANYHLVLKNPVNDTGESIGLAFGITDTVTKVGAAIIHERDAAGSQGSMKFFCRPSNGGPPVKRLHLHANGDMTFNNCTTTINSSNYGLYFLNDSNSTKSIFIRHSREANGSHTTAEFYGNQGSMRIYGDGDVKNTNNSYGSLSDETLKQDIVDASSQWNDIKSIKVRKFRFKSNPTGDLQIGVVAQELETVSPKLVTEVATSSDDLTSTETVKSVKYSVLYMKAIKALQEAMTRIETLESEVAALKSS